MSMLIFLKVYAITVVVVAVGCFLVMLWEIITGYEDASDCTYGELSSRYDWEIFKGIKRNETT